MAEYLLSEYADLVALQSQTQAILDKFAAIKAAALDVGQSIKTATSFFDNKGVGSNATLDQIKNVDAATKNYTASVTNLASQTKILAEQQKIVTQVQAQQTASLNENLQTRIRYQNSLNSIKKDEKENLVLLKDSVITQKEYKQRLIDTALQQEKYRQKIADVTKEIKAQQAVNLAPGGTINSAQAQNKLLSLQRNNIPLQNVEDIKAVNAQIDQNNKLIDENSDSLGRQKINIGNYSSTFGNFALTLRGLRGPTKLLGEALGFSAAQADQFRLIIEHAAQALAFFFKKKEANAAASAEEAAATATATSAEQAHAIVTEEDAAAIAARTTTTKTGNLSTETNTVVTNVNTLATEAGAVAQTELAVATTASTFAFKAFRFALLATGIGVVIAVVYGLVQAYKAVKKANEEANLVATLTADVNKDAAESAGKAAGSLKVFQAEIENGAISMEKRLQAIKNLKDAYPELLKNVSDEALLNGQAADAYDRVTESIIKKAKAEAAEAAIQKLESEKIAILLKSQLDAEQVNLKIAKTKEDIAISSGGTASAGGNFGGASRRAKQQALLDTYNDQKAADQKEIDEYNKKIEILAKLAGIAENIEVDKAKKDKKGKEQKESTKSLLDSEFELYKKDQTERIALYKSDVDNQKLSYDERLTALTSYSQSKQELIEAVAKDEIRKEDEKELVLQANYKKAKANERKNILIEIKNIETQKLLIAKQAGIDERTVNTENAKEIDTIEKQRIDAYLKTQKDKYNRVLQLESESFEKQNTANAVQYSGEIQQLNEFFKAGRLTKEQYNDARTKLDLEYHEKELKNAIVYAKRLITIELFTNQNIGKEKLKLFDLQKQLSDLGVKIEETDSAKKIRIAKKEKDAKVAFLEDVKKYADEVFGIISGLQNISTTTQKNALRDQSDANEKKAARDIEIVNASTASEQDKAAKITIINARLAAQKDEIARRERELQLQQAKIDKAKAIFDITINTAIAVVKTLPEGLYTGFTYLIAALGAAELAIAIATPIPKFKHGLKTDYEGHAIVGDGGRQEAIIRADGGIEITPATDTLTYINKGDRILPDIAQLQNLAMKNIAKVANGQPLRENHYQQIAAASMIQNLELQKENQKLLKKIADKPIDSISSNHSGMVRVISWGTKQIKYIDENTNW